MVSDVGLGKPPGRQTYRSIPGRGSHRVADTIAKSVVAAIIQFDQGKDRAGGAVFDHEIDDFLRESVARAQGLAAVVTALGLKKCAHRDLHMDARMGKYALDYRSRGALAVGEERFGAHLWCSRKRLCERCDDEKDGKTKDWKDEGVLRHGVGHV